jgi:hypothetical protein
VPLRTIKIGVPGSYGSAFSLSRQAQTLQSGKRFYGDWSYPASKTVGDLISQAFSLRHQPTTCSDESQVLGDERLYAYAGRANCHRL